MTTDDAAALLRASTSAVAFTGAGISTESGLPDFRSPGGLWAQWNPQEVATISALRATPRRFYAFYQARLSALAAARPNEAHYALVQLGRSAALHTIITQNIDGLHQAAGSQHVIELHGTLREAACVDCGALVPINVISEALALDRLPQCAKCSGLLKPNIVLFEELLPEAAYRAAKQACRHADVMLIVGSSLQVTPAAWLPEVAYDRGAALIIINDEPTPLDRLARVVIRGRAAAALAALARACGVSDTQRDSPR